MGASKVITLTRPAVGLGDRFEIQDSLPFDGRVVEVKRDREGVHIIEEIDGEKQCVYLSNAELGTLIYRLSEIQH